MRWWWIKKPFLMGGPNPTGEELEQIRKAGPGDLLVISLLDGTLQIPGYSTARDREAGLIFHTIPIMDFTPPAISQILEFLGLVGKLRPGFRAYVHCQGGIGRTGTMAAAFWIAQGLDPDSAVTLVRQTQPHAVETEEQMQRLREFHERFRRLFQA